MDEHTITVGLPASLVNGRLEGISVPDLLWDLCRRKSSGVLSLASRGITKRVYIEAGRIVFAASGEPNDRLGELLLRDGVITLDQLEAAITKLPSGKRLGTILVEAGHLSPDNLVRGVLAQVRGIVLGLFPIEAGEYHFAEGPLPTEEVVTLGMKTAEVVLQGIRQIRSFTRVRSSVGSPQTRFRLDENWRQTLDGLEIRDGERMLVQRIADGADRGASVDRLCREVFLSNFEIYQALLAFKVLGIVHEVERGFDVPAGSSFEGHLERIGLPQILVRLCRDGETGVLHVSRGTLERSLHIKDGVCVFATSNAIDDGLVAHLLRRGVISLRDREETARRLLSNKRVGTILLEMGVIDESDLLATVREQLSEIVFDTFRWDSGDFQFLSGELPTIEEITLDRTVEDLVFGGVRRVVSWSRVREGCGGLGARLVLLPEYLSVLDKMSVGAEEWELISVLRQPKTVLEVCRESVLGDFRSCQILWALRLLGAVGEAPVEQSVDLALGVLDGPAGSPGQEPAAETAPAPQEAVEAEIPASEAFDERHEEGQPVAAEAEPEPEPIAVSSADDTAEIISEPWRLAAERPPEDRPEATPAVLPIIDSPTDATLALSREEVEAALRAPEDDDGLPKFELGEPGSGLEGMQVDMAPDRPGRDFELGPPDTDADEVAPADEMSDGAGAGSAELTEQPDPVPVVDEPPPVETAGTSDPDETMEIPRGDVESALQEPSDTWAASEPASEAPAESQAPAEIEAAAEIEAPAETPWEPPAGLDEAIAGFNARHVILFRALRAEVGAGAANFVRSCRAGLAERFQELFATAELHADGSWDPHGVKTSVIEHRVGDAETGFRNLLDQEMELLRIHLGEKRVTALVEQLAAVS
jgi:Domain of unknown function (DUF4388)